MHVLESREGKKPNCAKRKVKIHLSFFGPGQFFVLAETVRFRKEKLILFFNSKVFSHLAMRARGKKGRLLMLNFHEALRNKRDQHTLRTALDLKYEDSTKSSLKPEDILCIV